MKYIFSLTYQGILYNTDKCIWEVELKKSNMA